MSVLQKEENYMQSLLSSCFLCLVCFLGPRNATQPIKGDGSGDVKSDIHPQQTKIPPSGVPADVDTLKELVGAVNLAKLALLRRLRVPYIATSHGDVILHVLPASLVIRKVEYLKLVVGAISRCLSECSCHEARDEVGERIRTVHENPEARKVIGAR